MQGSKKIEGNGSPVAPAISGAGNGKSLKDMVLEKQTGKQPARKKGVDNNAPVKKAEARGKPEKDIQLMPAMVASKQKDTKDGSVPKRKNPSNAVEAEQKKGEIKVPEKTVKAKKESNSVQKSIIISKEENGKGKEDKGKENRGKKANKALTLILALLCILLLLFATDTISSARIMSFFKSFADAVPEAVKSDDSGSGDVPVIDVSNPDSVSSGRLSTEISDEQARLNQIAENSRVYCIISSSPYFENADSKGSFFISNPPESVYYTQVVIKTKDTEKEMYVSPVLAPDEKVESDYLTDRSFASGQYQANAYFNYYTKTGNSGSSDDYSYIGTMCAEVLIVIDNKKF